MPWISWVTTSTLSKRKSAWLLEGVTVKSIGSCWAPMRRLTSSRDLAGTIKLTSSPMGSASLPWYTASLKPSAAAKVKPSPEISTLIPVNTGRESSVAAAKATWLMASRSTPASTLPASPASTVGIGGKSSASVPLICASNRAH